MSTEFFFKTIYVCAQSQFLTNILQVILKRQNDFADKRTQPTFRPEEHACRISLKLVQAFGHTLTQSKRISFNKT